MPFLIYLAKFLFFTLLSEFARPKAQQEKPAAAGLKDLNFPTVDQTRPHQWLIGRQLVDNPNLFATFDFESRERTKRVRTGLFRRENIVTGYNYYISFAMVLCGGTGVRLRRIWAGDRLLWEGNVGTGEQLALNSSWTEQGQPDSPRGFKGVVEFYSGPAEDGTVLTSPYLVEKRGVGNVPAWKHLTYVVLRGTGSGDSPELQEDSGLLGMLGQALGIASARRGMWIGTSTQVEHLKFEVERMPSAASTGVGEHPDAGNYWAIGQDANPAYAIAEVLTNPVFCAGVAPEELDTGSFHVAAKQLFEENHGTSQLWDSQRSSGDVVLELCRQVGGILQPDPLTGLHTLRLFRSDDEPVAVLNDENIKVLSQFSRNSLDEATNSLAVTYADRSDKYKRKPVEVLDDAAIEIAGRVITGSTNYAGITSSELANIIATRELRALSSPLATARLTALVPKRQRFLPGDVVLFSSVRNGITSLRMRVTAARYSKPGEALCELELIEDVFRSGEAVFSPPAPVADPISVAPGHIGWADYSVIAPWPLTSATDAPRMLFVAGAPITSPARATGYRLGYFDALETRDSSTVAWSDRYYSFGARARFSAAVGQSQAGVVSATATPSDAYTINRSAGRQVVAYVLHARGESGYQEPEFMLVSATASGLAVSLTIHERGIFGTMPGQLGANSYIFLLYDHVVDPAALLVNPSTDPELQALGLGVVAESLFVRAETIGPAGSGPFDTVDDSGLIEEGSPAFLSNLAPYGPGSVRVGTDEPVIGTAPTASLSDEWAVGVPASSGGTFSFIGRNRKRTELTEGYESGSGLEPGADATVTFASRPYPAIETTAFEPHGGFTGTSGSVPSLPGGPRLVCASVTITSPSAGQKSWHFYWVKPA